MVKMVRCLSALAHSRKVNHFLGAEDHGQRLRFFRSRDDVVEAPVPFEGHFVEEAKRRNSDENLTGRQLLSFVK